MGFNPLSSIRNKLRRGSVDTTKAVQEESEALKLEVQEEQEEVVVQKEVRGFSASWRREAALLKDLAAMQSAKYSLVRALSVVSRAKRNLSDAKKKIFSNLIRSGKRVQTLTRRAMIGATGVAAISPRFAADIGSWVTEQQRELQLLAREVEIQINENKQRAADINPIMVKNKQIREKLNEYLGVLGRENMQLSAARTNILKEIRKERKEMEDARMALQQEIDALRQSRAA